MKVYIVRHGQTISNIEKKYYGSYESELTEQGIAEATCLSEILKDAKFDYIFCSQSKRTKDTAKFILKDDKEVIIDCRLNERYFGIFENKSYSEIKEEFAEVVEEWENDWKDFKIPEGESALESYKRAEDFFRYIESLKADNILIITHGGFIRNTYCYILGSLEYFWKFASKNGDLTIVNYEYGNWYIDSITPIERMIK